MIKTSPQHDNSNPFLSQDNELVIGNSKISQLAQRLGHTPFYAYDKERIKQRMLSLRKHMPDDLKIHYAMKANPMQALVYFMADLVDGFDLASANEMQTALNTPMSTKNISMAGPGKRPEELSQAIAAGITINVESENELNTIVKIANKTGVQPHVAIRINPAFELKASGMKMGGGSKQFGIDEELLPSVLKKIQSLNINFNGFHIYTGSQNLKPDSIIEAQQKCLDLADQLSKHYAEPIKKINLGGGYGIPYFPNEKALDIQVIGEALDKAMVRFKATHNEANIVIELGRYLVGEAGIYVSKVIDKKSSRGLTYLIVDGGLHHNLAASGNFGQVIRKNYPVAIGNKMHSDEKEVVSIVGPLCTPLDTLADKMLLPKAEIGDLVVVYQSGAYGYTASPHQFLSQPKCVEALV